MPLKLLAKTFLIPLGLTTVASLVDTRINKKILRPEMTTLIISNIEIKEIWFIDNRCNETIKNKAKEQKRGSSGIFLGTLSASWLGSLLTGNRLTTKYVNKE